MSTRTTRRRNVHLEQSGASKRRDGFSLAEAIVSMTIMVFGVMALASATTKGMEQTNRGRADMQYSADVEQVVDSLIGVGWNNVTTGSVTVRGRAVAWTVTTLTANSQMLVITVPRPNDTRYRITTVDTVMLYLAKPTPGS